MHLTRLPLVSLLLLSLALPAAAKADSPVWTYQSGATSVVWTRQDIQVMPGRSAKPSLSLRRDFMEQYGRDRSIREVESVYQVLSAVGPVVTLQKSFYADAGGAHPTVATSYLTIDLRAPRQPALLTDYFPDQDVLKALLADGLVKKALATLPPAPAPKTTMELIQRLENAQTGCEYTFLDDFICAFSFHHVEGNRVAVRLGLPHGAEACRGNLTQIGLLLPIPAKLKADLKAAQTRRSGFLAKEAKAVHKGVVTKIRYAPRS